MIDLIKTQLLRIGKVLHKQKRKYHIW